MDCPGLILPHGPGGALSAEPEPSESSATGAAQPEVAVATATTRATRERQKRKDRIDGFLLKEAGRLCPVFEEVTPRGSLPSHEKMREHRHERAAYANERRGVVRGHVTLVNLCGFAAPPYDPFRPTRW